MLGVKLPFRLQDCEIAAYKLTQMLIERGYSADVRCKDGVYSAIIHKKRLLHSIIGTPAIVTASFFDLEDGTGIEVREGAAEISLENVVKDIALYALVIPGIMKRIDVVRLEKRVMRKALIAAKISARQGQKQCDKEAADRLVEQLEATI